MKDESSQHMLESTFWNISAEETLARTGSNVQGLTDKTAAERLKEDGQNSLKGKSEISAFMLFILQFKSPITLLLIAAALLSFALHDQTDAVYLHKRALDSFLFSLALAVGLTPPLLPAYYYRELCIRS